MALNPAKLVSDHQPVILLQVKDIRLSVLFESGEIHELKEELRVVDKSRKKDAVKKVIAAMTVGKDVSPIFPDVVNCMQTDDLELKKLVYLYLINYAKSQPDLAIMAVNTFVKVYNQCHAPSIALHVRHICHHNA